MVGAETSSRYQASLSAATCMLSCCQLKSVDLLLCFARKYPSTQTYIPIRHEERLVSSSRGLDVAEWRMGGGYNLNEYIGRTVCAE